MSIATSYAKVTSTRRTPMPKFRKLLEDFELMHRTCPNCGYEWDEAMED